MPEELCRRPVEGAVHCMLGEVELVLVQHKDYDWVA